MVRVSGWKQQTGKVRLPSGNEATLRQVDVLSILSEGGDVPNVLQDLLNGSGKSEVKVTDMLSAMPLLNRIARLAFVAPAVVDEGAAERGEGITVHQVSMYDKVAVMLWCMGGEAAVNAVRMFLEQSGEGVPVVQAGT